MVDPPGEEEEGGRRRSKRTNRDKWLAPPGRRKGTMERVGREEICAESGENTKEIRQFLYFFPETILLRKSKYPSSGGKCNFECGRSKGLGYAMRIS